MTISTTKKLLGVTGAAALIVSLAACGTAPEENTPTTPGAEAPTIVEGFLPCIVSDEGGFDDKSFNQLGYEGLVAAATELGVEYKFTESNSAGDYGPNLESLVAEGCTFIISVGFLLSAPTVEAALANPEVQYAIIDDWADNDFDGETDAPNIKPLVFDTAQAAFLGGYASAAVSQAGKVGTFGGAKIPPVTIFMDGFVKGVEYYNEENGDDVEAFGWTFGDDGSFTGGFEANDTAKQTALGILDQGVDVILPVGGPIYQSAAAAIRDSDRTVALLGVDADVSQTDPSVADLLLMSILKGMDVAVHEAVIEAAAGDFDPTPFVGTLENDGVGITALSDTFAEWGADAELTSKLEELAGMIQSGDITIGSPSSPVAG